MLRSADEKRWGELRQPQMEAHLRSIVPLRKLQAGGRLRLEQIEDLCQLTACPHPKCRSCRIVPLLLRPPAPPPPPLAAGDPGEEGTLQAHWSLMCSSHRGRGALRCCTR